jgi:hypothetical protein
MRSLYDLRAKNPGRNIEFTVHDSWRKDAAPDCDAGLKVYSTFRVLFARAWKS